VTVFGRDASVLPHAQQDGARKARTRAVNLPHSPVRRSESCGACGATPRDLATHARWIRCSLPSTGCAGRAVFTFHPAGTP